MTLPEFWLTYTACVFGWPASRVEILKFFLQVFFWWNHQSTIQSSHAGNIFEDHDAETCLDSCSGSLASAGGH